ncbi:MAG TPA: hypothetical protein VNX28_13080 [Gemmataceae bacterium]|jgi:hypothetical protein|nr:hypothetical protein [Gemmataceae bacterium]
MAEEQSQVPEGAAVLPLIPPELGIHPLLLAVLHAVVFFDGSSEDVVHDEAADEALNYLATYLQRLEGPDLRRIREDMDCLATFAREEKWPTEELQFLEGFLKEYGVAGEKS